MEWCDGGNLHELIYKTKYQKGRFSDEEIGKFLANIILGLFELHKNGIQHRDIKPLNVMINRENGIDILKITDYGLAKSKYNPKQFQTSL